MKKKFLKTKRENGLFINYRILRNGKIFKQTTNAFYPIECLFRIFKNSNLLITSTFPFLREYKIDRQIVNHCTISV
jgi:hypothetical protein